MAGNSRRHGGARKNKKGPSKGSAGEKRRGLRGKGPTPKAEDRVYHQAHKRKKAAQRRLRTQQAEADAQSIRAFTVECG